MKPYGIDKKLKSNFPDRIRGRQRKEGLINWWEDEFKKVIKGRERRNNKFKVR